MCLLK